MLLAFTISCPKMLASSSTNENERINYNKYTI